jgi:hypothetical protein
MYQAFELWTAAEVGDLEMARTLLNDKADVNARDPTRFPPCAAADVEVGSLVLCSVNTAHSKSEADLNKRMCIYPYQLPLSAFSPHTCHLQLHCHT